MIVENDAFIQQFYEQWNDKHKEIKLYMGAFGIHSLLREAEMFLEKIE